MRENAEGVNMKDYIMVELYSCADAGDKTCDKKRMLTSAAVFRLTIHPALEIQLSPAYRTQSCFRSSCSGQNVSHIQRTSVGSTLGRVARPTPLALCLPESVHHSEIIPPQVKVRRLRYSVYHTIVNILLPLFHKALFVYQTADTGRMGYPAELPASHTIHHKVLDRESLRMFLNPPTTDPLFPKFRHLRVHNQLKFSTCCTCPFHP